jgi:predicted acylesterase/phospholipase RssA
MKRVIRPFAAAACAVALAACATVARTPYTPQDQSAAVIPGIPDARVWADDPRIATEQPVVSGVALKQPTALALSGGGADGAFGAGLLVGWSERGTRPQFTIVTGASAGAPLSHSWGRPTTRC